jgi:hypothetical protein
LHASLFGALKASAGGCDCPCVWTVLLCGLCCLCCSYGLDYAASMLLYGCFYGLHYVMYLPMLASLIHLWATKRVDSLTSSLSKSTFTTPSKLIQDLANHAAKPEQRMHVLFILSFSVQCSMVVEHLHNTLSHCQGCSR